MSENIRPLGMAFGSIKDVIPKLMTYRLKQAKVPYTFDQMIVILIVNHCPKAQQEIACIMRRDKSVILRMIDLLEKDGLLTRIPDADDRRRNNLVLTEHGSSYVKIYNKIERELTKDLLVGLSKSEIESFYKVIDHIREKGNEL